MFARHTVAIAIILDQACRSDPHSFFDIAIKGAAQWAQHDLLIHKDVGNRAILLIGMPTVYQLLAAQPQPGIQRVQIAKSKPGSEQLAAQKLDLVLDLTLLPARRWS